MVMMVMTVMSPVSMMMPMVYPATGCGDDHGRWPHDHGWRDEYDWWSWQDRERDPNAHGHVPPHLRGAWHGKTGDTHDNHDPTRP